MKRQALVSSLILLLITGFVSAATINVPDANLGIVTIQDGIDAASNGDEVVVATGTYTGIGNRDIDFKGKAITVRSTDPNSPSVVAATIIDCQGLAGGFYFHSNENTNSVVAGLTIKNGLATYGYGGGIECDGASPTISKCVITNNQASSYGGGVDLYMSSAVIVGCTITNNSAAEGGGINCDTDDVGSPTIADCYVSGNYATSSSGVGAGINCYNSSPTVKNCFMENNAAAREGGAIYLRDSGSQISNCTIVNNSGLGNFGGIYRGGGSGAPNIINSILWNNGDDLYNCDGFVTYSCIEDGDGGTGNMSDDPLFRTGPLGNYYLSQISAGQLNDSPCVDAGSGSASTLGFGSYTTRTDNGSDTDPVDMGFHYPDTGPVASYLLTTSVVDANGSINPNHPSPGSSYVQYTEVALTASPNVGYQLKAWTGTDDDSSMSLLNVVTMDSNETVTVEFEPVTRYTLILTAGPNGRVEPRRVEPNYPAGTVINLTAFPDAGYRVSAWTGADNVPAQDTNTNTVTMTSDKTVNVTFAPDYNLTVNVIGGQGTVEPQSGSYFSGTVVTLTATPQPNWRVKAWTGTDNDPGWNNNTNTVTMNGDKIVTIEFEQTRILYVGGDGQYPTIHLAIDDAHDGDIIQIAPANEPYQTSWGFDVDKNITITSANPDDPCVVASTVIEQVVGPDGSVRSAFRFWSGGSNAVLNGITMRNFRRRGIDGRDNEPDGEYGCSVSGGAINCYNASPTIKNCVIYDCNIIGGDGGDGADGDVDVGHPDGYDGGWPGYAYGGAIAIWPGSNPTIINTTFDNCVAFGGNGGDGGNGFSGLIYGHGGRAGGWTYAVGSWWYGTPLSPIAHDGFSTDYSRYSGLGGAIYVGLGASVSITDCNFINCRTIGGQTGIGGQTPPSNLIDEPSIRWRIDNFGGAIHFAGNNTGLIENCTFINNFADTNTAPDGTPDPFVSYGGAIDLEDSANVTISNCTFRGNSATIGGAVHGTWSDPVISDCNFWSNWAYHGAGALFVGGTIQIERSDFSGNTAVNAAAQGGGICSLGANGQIVDCNVSNNSAAGSGGGIYVSSKDVFEQTVSVEGPVVIKNCLITDNTAGRDGGGISANWYAEPNIINCTIANNTVTGIGFGNSYGGGLYSAYGNYSNVLNSILWGNSASNGTQIGIGNGAGNDPGSTVSVSYSDVQGGQAYVFFDENCTLEWGAGNIHTDPLFVTGPLGDYYLSQIAAGQPVDSDCVDAGSDLAIDVGLHQYTTRTDEVLDTTIVDMGYHYPLAHPIESCGLSDLSGDGIVNFTDQAILVLYWLRDDCSANNDWCDGADLTFDGYVNSDDLIAFYECWLAEDTDAPTPNPSRWEIEPYSTSIAVSMTAEEAFDNWGGVVAYYFECVTGNGSDRGWEDPNRTNRTYTDSNNLVKDTVYGYRVKARDERGNETEWSVIRYAMAAGEERNYYAVICGIADYQGVENDLPFPTNDAYSLYQILIESGNWEEGNITMLLDSSATKAAIQSAIQTMATRLDSDDVFLFYFAGHGTAGPEIEPFDELDGYDEYLATYDLAEVGSEEYINFQDLLRDDELGDWLEELPTDDYIVILDSCFSGGTIDGFSVRGLGDNVPVHGDGFAEDLLRIAQGQSPIALTACDEDEVAYETFELGHGVFTYYLLDAMYGRGDDEGNGNGWVSGEECYDYLVNRVNSYMERFGVIGGQYGQHPQLYDADPANEFEYLLLEPINPGSPAAPSNLQARAAFGDQIDLSWTDNSNNEERFRIDRKTIGSMFEQIAAVGADETSYSDMWLVPETPYTYRVRAYNGAGDSAWSNEASATTLEAGEEPPPPDTTPPTPNPSQWAAGGEPTQYLSGGYYWHTMTAEPASDAENEPVEYYFELVAGGYGPTSSGWQLSNVYNYPVSVNPAQYGVYKVRTRDAVGNMTDWSGIGSTLE